MFERFTERARRVVVLAQEEARALNHNYIGTEHILLGLVHDGEGVAAEALESLGISLEAVRLQVEEIIGRGASASTGHIPFTPRAKKVLELSLREALQLGHDYIGTEHILLGLIREGEGVAAQVLQRLGAGLERVRQEVLGLLSGTAPREHPASGPPPESIYRLAGYPLSDRSRAAIDLAGALSRKLEHSTIEPGDILLALLITEREDVFGAVLTALHDQIDRVRDVLDELPKREEGESTGPP